MPRDPKYIRLADRLTDGIVADLNTGFSIAGLDVQDFPEDPAQQAYVRSQMHAGVIEAASAEEYTTIRGTNERMAAANPVGENLEVPSAWQENKIQAAAKETRRQLAAARQIDYNDPEWDPLRGRSLLDADLSYEQDQARREALAEHIKQEGLDSDDPEEQLARAGTPVRRPSKTKKAGGDTVPASEVANRGGTEGR